MTNKELEQRINKLEQELAELKKIKVEEPKRWKPKNGEGYYYISNWGDIYDCHWEDSIIDNFTYSQDNCFKTRKEAEYYKRKLEVKAIYKNYILENSEPLDWNNGESDKYSAYIVDSKILIDFNYKRKYQGTIYASSREITQQALNLIPEEDRYMLFEE